MDLLSSFHARSTRETARRTRVRIDGTCLVGAPPSAAECRSLVLFLRGLAAGRKHLLQVLVLQAPDALVLRHGAAGAHRLSAQAGAMGRTHQQTSGQHAPVRQERVVADV